MAWLFGYCVVQIWWLTMSSSIVIAEFPLGNLLLREQDGFIIKCQFTKNKIKKNNASILLHEALYQLELYFSGHRTDFDLPLLQSGTSFQKNVWATLQTIPYGETWSYQQLAQAVGKPKASRAVGTANAKNSICIFIPCHRVILATGKSGSYAGGENTKIALLNLEKNRI